ncbi:palmitoyltransferase ZDHHC6 [Schistocerca gregaria]|uniref:palmitoyltransferase ZDHHC6 n=1 Tax=Schistocerca gregaria TaxID=7010 RepID=UPI00211E73D1|nr:palmitoyltransferase ZDHHC6 [Schistocerca gregaria]
MAKLEWRRIIHWGPLTALGIVKIITFMMVHCCSMWWPPAESISGFINLAVFMLFSGLTICNFLNAIFDGPGYLPPNWQPENPDDSEYLQFCNVCHGYKAPRSHHCGKCGHCVMKMDHHCPWINNCVGHRNHGYFTAFLFFAVCGCLQASIELTCCLYRALNRVWYLYYGNGTEPIVYLGTSMLVLCVLALGLAIGVVLAVGMLLCFQLRAVFRNRTAIEDWIMEKAKHRRKGTDEIFIFPYNLGWKHNFRQVINWSLVPAGDGVFWPVADGCNQFTLTMEQKEQKAEKRSQSRTYIVRDSYCGSWVPVSKGWRILFYAPCTDEHRLPLDQGDVVLVTRWRRYWLFGEKQKGAKVVGHRGWFPRCCVVELAEAIPNDFDKNK